MAAYHSNQNHFITPHTAVCRVRTSYSLHLEAMPICLIFYGSFLCHFVVSRPWIKYDGLTYNIVVASQVTDHSVARVLM
ncbi:hypothetical protein LIPSTDRAFT_76340, partial [Lipomyces starkeyi NRRL Y-11557]